MSLEAVHPMQCAAVRMYPPGTSTPRPPSLVKVTVAASTLAMADGLRRGAILMTLSGLSLGIFIDVGFNRPGSGSAATMGFHAAE